MRVTVTGAGGLSGARIVGALLARGHQVTAAIRSGPGRLATLVPAAGCAVLRGDLADGVRLPEGTDAVVHAAATSPSPGVVVDAMVRDNVLGSRLLLEECRRIGVGCVIHLSSLSVYGAVGVPVADEATPIVDPDAYGLTKRLAEMLVDAPDAPWRALSLRLPGLIGPGSGRNWLSRTLAALQAQQPVRIFNPDAPFNNAVHIDDLADFVVHLVESAWSGRDVVTLAADGAMSIGDVVALLRRAAGSRSPVETAAGKQGFTISNRRAKALYGFRPGEIADCLRRFARDNGADAPGGA